MPIHNTGDGRYERRHKELIVAFWMGIPHTGRRGIFAGFCGQHVLASCRIGEGDEYDE
jgi:hypothetical protein